MSLRRVSTSACFLLVTVTALAITAWAGQAGASNTDAAVFAPLTRVPAKAKNRTNPLEHDPEAAIAGRKLFERHCAECHGSDAKGGRRGPSLVAPPVQKATPGELFWILTNGVVRQGMPVWSRLPEPQRWQIVTYLNSLRLPDHSP
jgi:mono/diheme cytochrome c family protein